MSGAHLSLILASTLIGCAAAPVKRDETPPPPPPVQTQCPKIDVERLGEVVAIDRETQEQISKVTQLEQQLSSLQQKLDQALKAGGDASDQVSVASTGSKVRVRLSDELLFGAGSARVSRAGRHALDQVASVLKDDHAKRFEVAGHSDSAPIQKKYRDNWELSMERARRVGSYLIEKGVDGKRMVMSGYADSEPVDAADSDEARAKNRRVEIFIEPTGHE